MQKNKYLESELSVFFSKNLKIHTIAEGVENRED